MACCLILIGFFLGWTFALRPSVAHSWRVVQTQTQLAGLSSAISNYYQYFGVWPPTLKELQNNKSNIVFYLGSLEDAWGGAIQMSPPVVEQRPGQVISYGADKVAGGAGSNADLMIPFGKAVVPIAYEEQDEP